MSGFSRKAAAGALNFFWGKEESLAKPAKVYLALTTVVPTNSSTAGTITEATAEGYVRKEVPVGSIEKAKEGATSVIKTSAELVFAGITSGESTIIGWALCDSASGAGNIIMWGTCTSTTISTTQTPPTVASEKLVGEVS